MRKVLISLLLLVMLSLSVAFAQTAQPAQKTVALPPVNKAGTMPLEQAMAQRRSARAFKPTPLTPQQMSQLLWAAQGMTDSPGHRAAPSAHSRYYITVYAVSSEGLFRYDPKQHALVPLPLKDAKAVLNQAGGQPSFASAPFCLVVAGDYKRAAAENPKEDSAKLVNLEAGHVAQNVLLEATALELAGVPAAGINVTKVQQTLGLDQASVPIYVVPLGQAK